MAIKEKKNIKNFLIMSALGMSCGAPLAAGGQMLTARLATQGISKSSIGIFALAGLPYSIKFLWAPIIDCYSIPIISNKLGKHRSWLIVCQLLSCIALISLGMANPLHSLIVSGILACFLAFCSATQDICADACRIFFLNQKNQGLGAAYFLTGYRIGLLIAGGLSLIIADNASLFFPNIDPWIIAYCSVVPFVMAGLVAVLFLKFEDKTELIPNKKDSFTSFLKSTFLSLKEQKNFAITALIVCSYKIGDALAFSMLTPFLLETGFTLSQIGLAAKTIGMLFSLTGGFIGGFLIFKISIQKAMFVCAIAQMITTPAFLMQIKFGANIKMLFVTIGAENIAAGMGTAAIVAYISSLCKKEQAATQYACYTAMAAFVKIAISTLGGTVAQKTSWSTFFLISTVISLPGVLLTGKGVLCINRNANIIHSVSFASKSK